MLIKFVLVLSAWHRRLHATSWTICSVWWDIWSVKSVKQNSHSSLLSRCRRSVEWLWNISSTFIKLWCLRFLGKESLECNKIPDHRMCFEVKKKKTRCVLILTTHKRTNVYTRKHGEKVLSLPVKTTELPNVKQR